MAELGYLPNAVESNFTIIYFFARIRILVGDSHTKTYFVFPFFESALICWVCVCIERKGKIQNQYQKHPHRDLTY